MAAGTYENRVTFPRSDRARPRKIALEEAVSTSVFVAAQTVPPVARAAESTYVTDEYAADIEERLTNIGLRVPLRSDPG
ncbi:hypothetical protein FHT40_006749 [Mycolicibacterium sp. BK556]|uniref:hypothetical protein n=1 Tax=unclassified Mycolicibacterium TaxID=2636767 RepID=UPI00104AEF0E|nr:MULTISPECIES: hypothetical protein [unclassified Mycolicibacterium]MBB3607049.1 hypothetical protein [Mycolicibacterium sp. BK556]MBB3636841.1 hypothetical protein [Mycolicibacterium sp. BK607]